MTYQDECRLRAQYLLEAADGVEFQEWSSCTDSWRDVKEPKFNYSLGHYRRKPKKVRHERVVLWTINEGGAVGSTFCLSNKHADQVVSVMRQTELKRETVFVEVEE